MKNSSLRTHLIFSVLIICFTTFVSSAWRPRVSWRPTPRMASRVAPRVAPRVATHTNKWMLPVDKKLEAFSSDLFRAINEDLDEDQNMIFSPISIFSALSLVGQGTDHNTRKQIKHALHTPSFASAQEFVQKTFRPSSDYDMSIAQRVFVDNSTLLKKDYKDFLNETGLNSVKKVDFRGDSETARQKINSWVHHHTLEQIEELLREDQVTPFTRIYVVNAVALEAAWATKFDKEKKETFKISADRKIKADVIQSYSTACMIERRSNNRRHLTDTTILVLPFQGEKLTYIAVMPNNPGDFSEMSTRTGQKKLFTTLNAIMSRTWGEGRLMFHHNCQVTIPKLKLEHNYNQLRDHLEGLGIEDLFDANLADLSKLYRSDESMYVSDVAHKATFSLDKNGVKATAATAFGMSLRTIPPSVTIDKPFLFFVRSQSTGALLFMGKVVDPSRS